LTNEKNFDVLIIGGSYAGLSAAMTLGRAVRSVLIIDSGKPCNAPTPHSHNFLTQDGKTPAEISALAKEQVSKYKTVVFYSGLAITAQKTEGGFEITTATGDHFKGKKIIFATGIKDMLPGIPGVAECWGITVIHCPYCHGYEVKNERTGILSNGDAGFEFCRMISNWTKDLTLYTNGKSTLTADQVESLKKNNIRMVEDEIDRLEHQKGQIQHIVFKDNSAASLKAMYARPTFIQHSDLPAALGCELAETGHIKVDISQKTNVPGVFACGDNSNLLRAVSAAVSSGTAAGAMCNREMIEEEF
jgi:thioredoxin reductase